VDALNLIDLEAGNCKGSRVWGFIPSLAGLYQIVKEPNQ